MNQLVFVSGTGMAQSRYSKQWGPYSHISMAHNHMLGEGTSSSVRFHKLWLQIGRWANPTPELHWQMNSNRSLSCRNSRQETWYHTSEPYEQVPEVHGCLHQGCTWWGSWLHTNPSETAWGRQRRTSLHLRATTDLSVMCSLITSTDYSKLAKSLHDCVESRVRGQAERCLCSLECK